MSLRSDADHDALDAFTVVQARLDLLARRLPRFAGDPEAIADALAGVRLALGRLGDELRRIADLTAAAEGTGLLTTWQRPAPAPD